MYLNFSTLLSDNEKLINYVEHQFVKYFKQYKGDSTKPYGPLKPDKNKINGFIFLKVNESFFSKSIRKVNIPK